MFFENGFKKTTFWPSIIKDKEDGEREAGITVAKDMGHISECALILKKVWNGLIKLILNKIIDIFCTFSFRETREEYLD